MNREGAGCVREPSESAQSQALVSRPLGEEKGWHSPTAIRESQDHLRGGGSAGVDARKNSVVSLKKKRLLTVMNGAAS